MDFPDDPNTTMSFNTFDLHVENVARKKHGHTLVFTIYHKYPTRVELGESGLIDMDI